MEKTKMPSEVMWALLLIVVATVCGVIVALASMALKQKLGGTVDGFGYFRLSVRTVFAIAYIIGIANGHGWVRWVFVISIVATVFFLGFILFSRLGSQGQLRLLMTFILAVETPLLLLRAAAVVLLFRPPAQLWFGQRAATTVGQSE